MLGIKPFIVKIFDAYVQSYLYVIFNDVFDIFEHWILLTIVIKSSFCNPCVVWSRGKCIQPSQV